MTWDEVKELGPLYVLGALDEKTARAVQDYLRTATPEQRREIAEWSEVTALIPLGLPSVPVPAHLKGRLMSRISTEPQMTPVANEKKQAQPEIVTATETGESSAKVLQFSQTRSSQSTTTRWLLMAATALLTFTTGYLLWQNMRLRGENVRLAQVIEEKENQVSNLISPSTKWITLAGQEAPQASAKLVWDTKLQTWVIYVYNLPTPPADKSYQLWYVTNTAPVSAAVFGPQADGRYKPLELTLPPGVVNNLAATAVTLEPKGGSPQPTNDKYFLIGKI